MSYLVPGDFPVDKKATGMIKLIPQVVESTTAAWHSRNNMRIWQNLLDSEV